MADVTLNRDVRIESLNHHYCQTCHQPLPSGDDEGPIKVDLRRNKISHGIRVINMFQAEIELFSVLYKHRGQVVPLQRLYRAIWGVVEPPSAPNALRVYKARLSAALRKHGFPCRIVSVHSIGYELVMEDTGACN